MVRKDTEINQKIVLKLGKASTEAFSGYQETCWNAHFFLHDGLKNSSCQTLKNKKNIEI